MTRGPHRKPAEIARAQGNPGRRPLGEVPETHDEKAQSPAEVNTDRIQPPDWLKNEAALQIWSVMAPELVRLRLLRVTDQTAFGRYCDHFARWLSLREKVDEAGETYVTESRHGKMQRQNPDFVAMLRVEDRMISIEDRFGLSPSHRGRILAQLATAPATLPLGDGGAAKKPTGDDPPAPRVGAVGLLKRPSADDRVH